MNEFLSIVLILAIFWITITAFSLNNGGGYSWPASETDPFEGRHIHIVTRQEDIDALPCDVPGCIYYEDAA